MGCCRSCPPARPMVRSSRARRSDPVKKIIQSIGERTACVIAAVRQEGVRGARRKRRRQWEEGQGSGRKKMTSSRREREKIGLILRSFLFSWTVTIIIIIIICLQCKTVLILALPLNAKDLRDFVNF